MIDGTLRADPVFSPGELDMQIENFSFGSIRIDGITHEHDVVIEGGKTRKPKKRFRKNSATTLETLLCLWRKTFPESAAGW